MWAALRRFWQFFLIGFIITFVIYLFVRYDADQILLGIVIAIAGGVVLAAVIFALERRFPERTDLTPRD
jgi:uncharacterized membrane protein YdjX (TVP38/TMEM64 family)